jgi:hypothetical protein
MSDRTEQTEERAEPRDLDLPAEAAQEVRPFLTANHNESLVRGYIVNNHNETLARKEQDDELRDLDVPAGQAEDVRGGAKRLPRLPRNFGESQDSDHKAEIQIESWR